MKLSSTLFVGPKTSRAIPAHLPFRRDFLIQSTLDGAVRRLEFHPALRVGDAIERVDGVVVESDIGRHAVDFVDARPESDPLGHSLMDLAFAERCDGILAVTADDVRREPRLSSCREVWRHHRTRVHTDDRAQILGAIENEGPIPMRALAGLVDTPRDLPSVVFALACTAEIEFDLRLPMSDRTIVRLGTRSFPAARLAYGT
jgi:hypothetical protein